MHEVCNEMEQGQICSKKNNKKNKDTNMLKFYYQSLFIDWLKVSNSKEVSWWNLHILYESYRIILCLIDTANLEIILIRTCQELIL